MSQPQAADASAFWLRADDSAKEIRRDVPADVTSLQHVFAPESVAVIGASRRRGTVGRAILDNIRSGGFSGRVYAINPRVRQIGGERCLPSALDLPDQVDLAVIAVPSASVLGVAEQCGQRGVRALVVITSELDTAASANLLAVCRRHGMRLVGPNCFGVAVPGIGLDATFAVGHPDPDPKPAARLAPLTDADADALIHSIRSPAPPLGDGDTPAAAMGALRDVLLRVSRLAQDLTEITDLELSLVITRPGAVVAVDARIKVAPHEPHDPFLRRLR